MKVKILRRVLGYAKKYIGYVVLAFVFAALSVALTLLAPVIIGRAVDCIVGEGSVNFDGVLKYSVYLIVIVSASALFSWLLSVLTNKIAYRTINAIRCDAFEKLERVPLSYIDGRAKGDIMATLVTDTDSISDGLIQGFTQLFTGSVTILGTLSFMLALNFKIALVVICITPLSLFVASFISKYSYKLFEEQSRVRGELGGFVNEMVSNQKTVNAFSYEEKSFEKFCEINSRLYDCGVKAQFYSSLTNPSTRFVNGMVYAAVAVAGALAAVSGGMSVGMISTFLAYANQYTKPFNEITGVITELQTAIAGAERVFTLIDEKEELSDEGFEEITECDGTVKISDVNFSYIKEVPLIENFSLDVKSGERVAIVGPTGCGKTTMINLLMRFYDADSGDITVSGKSVYSVTRDSLRSCYGMVLQDTWLFEGTVRDNIAYGKPDATDDEIKEAARLAFAHGFIKRLPDGYDTVISDDGGNISQGQKQLLCIARVMLTKPPMLILDEATSSIDTMTEIRVQKAFGTVMEGRTSFVIAHRLSTIKEADIILVMKNGHIIETGTHLELLNNKGFYYELFNSQYVQK